MLKPLTLTLAASLATFELFSQSSDRIQFNDQDLFLNGLNLAWDRFADDIGPNPNTPDLQHFGGVFDLMQDHGSNAMRLWLHTNGANTPAWNGMTVSGPGDDAIEDLRAILDAAWERKVGLILCLWSFDMQRTRDTAIPVDHLARNKNILTTTEGRNSYVQNALIPMVDALKGHPAIIAWEIFNEPEGMTTIANWNFTQNVPMSDIQAFINVCAGAIHRTDPDALVTNGSWSFFAMTDVGAGNTNYYTDARLIAAGGDQDGTLDFYTVHYYDWAGTIRSPFQNDASHWNLDKPLVVAEFHADCANCTDTAYETLYDRGYAGALAWSWTDSDQQSMLDEIRTIAAAHPAESFVTSPGAPTVALTSPTNGLELDAGANLTIAVNAADTDGGSISRVDIYTNDLLIKRLTQAPFETELANLPGGSYRFSAIARDQDGKAMESLVVPVFVNDPGSNRIEFEDGTRTSEVNVGQDLLASGGSYIDFPQTGTVTLTVGDIPADGDYAMTIGYQLPFGNKNQNLIVNGGDPVSLEFSGATGQWLQRIETVSLTAGTNTIAMQADWGFMYFDYIEFEGSNPVEAAILSYEFNEHGIEITFQGTPGKTYRLAQSTDLQPDGWETQQTATAPPIPFIFVDDDPMEGDANFYQVQEDQ